MTATISPKIDGPLGEIGSTSFIDASAVVADSPDPLSVIIRACGDRLSFHPMFSPAFYPP